MEKTGESIICDGEETTEGVNPVLLKLCDSAFEESVSKKEKSIEFELIESASKRKEKKNQALCIKDMKKLENILSQSGWHMRLSRSTNTLVFEHSESAYSTFNMTEIIESIIANGEYRVQMLQKNVEILSKENTKLIEENKILQERCSMLEETNKLAMKQVKLATIQLEKYK